QIGDALLQGFLVHLVGNGIDDDGLAVAAFHVLEVDLGAHDHPPAPGTVAFAHARHAVDGAPGGEIRRRDALDQFVDGAIGVAQTVQTAFDDLGQVVRRNV